MNTDTEMTEDFARQLAKAEQLAALRLEWYARACKDRDAHKDSMDRFAGLLSKAKTEVNALREEVTRLQAAHDHQHKMAGLMLREAETASAKVKELKEVLAKARKACAGSDALHALIDKTLADE
jgi:hypothetical protein